MLGWGNWAVLSVHHWNNQHSAIKMMEQIAEQHEIIFHLHNRLRDVFKIGGIGLEVQRQYQIQLKNPPKHTGDFL